jgi:hypothetical protein
MKTTNVLEDLHKDLADVFAGMATIKFAEGDKLRFKYEIPSRILGGVMERHGHVRFEVDAAPDVVSGRNSPE